MKHKHQTLIYSPNASKSYILRSNKQLIAYLKENEETHVSFESFDSLTSKFPMILIASKNHLRLNDFSQDHLFATGEAAFRKQFSKFSNVDMERYVLACAWRRGSAELQSRTDPVAFADFVRELMYWVFDRKYDNQIPLFRALAKEADNLKQANCAEAEADYLYQGIKAKEPVSRIHKI
jgi:hypothetical protein